MAQNSKDAEEIKALALRAGLERAVSMFPEDVVAAAHDAALSTDDLVRPDVNDWSRPDPPVPGR